MLRDCPRCQQKLDIDLGSKSQWVVCPRCKSGYSHVGLERVSLLSNRLRRIGNYRIVQYLGSGEFVDVWEAADEATNRAVAVKIPHVRTAEQRIPLIHETRATSHLDHPGIVKVHEIQNDGDFNFAVCDLVRGVSLNVWLRRQSATPRQAAEICAGLASAVHHAHERGVVHRDLKPSNILIDSQGNPHITDFGLAACESDDTINSLQRYQQALRLIAARNGQRQKPGIVGTPAYISPEQAHGDDQRVDRRNDIFALGVILYELLTDRRCFTGKDVRGVLRNVVREQPIRPRKVNRDIPVDLETICLRAMAKNPNRRYQTAEAMAADCQRVLQGKPIEARQVTPLERTWDSLRHSPVEAVLVVFLTALLVGAAVLLWRQLST